MLRMNGRRNLISVTYLLLILTLGLNFLAVNAEARPAATEATTEAYPFFSSPEDSTHQQVINHIATAQTSIDMWMFHITDHGVVDALCRAAQSGVKVRAILNRAMFKQAEIKVPVLWMDEDGTDPQMISTSADQTALDTLEACGVILTESSSGFSITHAKTLLLDQNRALIMTMNMTERAARTRDVGMLVDDPALIKDLKSLFRADLKNALDDTHLTPTIHSEGLVIAPLNATQKLVQLIANAQREVDVVVENIGKTDVTDALADAAARGIKVRVMAPMCDLIPNHYYNLEALRRLESNGAEVMAMPGKASFTQPYLHEKMMLIDEDTSFIGSENISNNSLKRAREIGFVQHDKGVANGLRNLFNQDWSQAAAVPSRDPSERCQSF